MREPTKEDIDALVGPATPHFAPQLRARVEELVLRLPDGHPTKKYALPRPYHASGNRGSSWIALP